MPKKTVSKAGGKGVNRGSKKAWTPKVTTIARIHIIGLDQDTNNMHEIKNIKHKLDKKK